MAEENQLVVGSNGNALSISLSSFFKDVDYSGLNNALDTMAKCNGDLPPDQRTIAIGILEKWQIDIIQRLEDYGKEMTDLLNLFEVGSRQHDLLDQMGDNIAEATNTQDQLAAWLNAVKELRNWKYEEPKLQAFNEDIQLGAKMKIEHDFKLAKTQWDFEKDRLERTAYLKEVAWKKVINAHPAVEEIIKRAKKFKKNSTKMGNECKDKAQIAKLNISISSKEMRESFKQLLDFAANF